jgi:SAM-dependent methyltransferase
MAPFSHQVHAVVLDPQFTRRNRDWFSMRYDFASRGVYFPHQPIYGFSRFQEHIQDYFRTYHILRLLEEIEFASFLDVGCAEGYLANLVRRCFGAETCGIDIAASGVQRMKELYRVPGAAADARHLPFRDRSFDVVLISETLEHVADPRAVIAELIRVARRFLIITTPAARNQAELDEHFKHLDPNLIFSHFHFFTESQMRTWLPPGSVFLGIGHRSMLHVSRWFSSGYDQAHAIRDLVEFFDESCPGLARETLEHYRRMAHAMVSQKPPWWQSLTGPRALGLALRLDHWLSRRYPQQTLAFLTLTPCHGTPVQRHRRPVRGLARYLLRENRVNPLKLAAVTGGNRTPALST